MRKERKGKIPQSIVPTSDVQDPEILGIYFCNLFISVVIINVRRRGKGEIKWQNRKEKETIQKF